VDLITNTAVGIKNTTTYFDENTKMRSRLPRHFLNDKVLSPYNKDLARGQLMLRTIRDGKYSDTWFVFCCRSDGKHWLLLSNVHIFLIKVENEGKANESYKDLWHARILTIQDIKKEATGVALTILKKSDKKSKIETIPCDSESVKETIVKRINLLISELNQNWGSPIDIKLLWEKPISAQQFNEIKENNIKKLKDTEALEKKKQQEQESKTQEIIKKQISAYEEKKRRMKIKNERY